MAAGMSGFLGLNPWSADPMQSLTAVAQQSQDQPAPAPAPAPEPAHAAPASGGGGLSGFLGGLFGGGGAQPGDDKVDPNTGATVGQVRQANLQSMQKLGLILLASSGRMTGDQRAAILSRAGDALDNSGQLNEFAKMRLQMANARLAERKQAQAEQKSAYVRALLGGSGAAKLGVPGAPGAVADGAGAAGGPADASAGAVAPAGAPGGPVAAPAAGGPLDGISPGLRAIAGGMDDDKALDTLARARQELDGQETLGTPYQDQATGQLLAPVMKGGRQIRVQAIGHLTPQMTEETGPGGGTRRLTKVGGVTTNIQDQPEDPQDREERAASVGLRKQRYDALAKARPDIEAAATNYDRVAAAQKAVQDGNTLAGFGADQKEQAYKFLSATGMMTDAGLAHARQMLAKTSDVNAILAQSGGEFAKQFYGPQISEGDVTNANKAVGAILSNDPVQVAAALGRIKDSYRQKIEGFDRDAKSHNERLTGIRSDALRADLQIQPIGRNFDQPPAQQQPASPRTAPQRAYTPEQVSAAQAELARRRAQQGAR